MEPDKCFRAHLMKDSIMFDYVHGVWINEWYCKSVEAVLIWEENNWFYHITLEILNLITLYQV